MNCNINNEKVKRNFLKWAKHAEGLSDITLRGIELAIQSYEEYTNYADFKTFNADKAIKYKQMLSRKEFRGIAISPATYRTYLKYLKRFFSWLCQQNGYKSKIKADSIAYFNLRRDEERIAWQYNHLEYPMPDYCIKLAKSIKIENDVDYRDKAMIGFTFETGMRPHAVVSLPLECIDEDNLLVYQNPKLGVRTKFSKYITSKIFNFDNELTKCIVDYVKQLKEKGASISDPLFPASKPNQNQKYIAFRKPIELSNKLLESTHTIRKVFIERAKAAGINYYSPRTFRHTSIYYALKFVRSFEEFKALSQNFGHEDIKTTLRIYGNFDEYELLEILNGLDFSKKNETAQQKKLEEALKIFNDHFGPKFST